MTVRARLLMTALTLLVVSCGVPLDGAASETTSTVGVPASIRDETTTTGSSTTTLEESVLDEAKLIEAATRDLSRRLLTAEENIEVVEVRFVEWPDGSIGCPEEGVLYTQALVEGAQVLLRFDDKVYDYHAGSDGQVFLCPSEDKDGGYDFVPPPGFND